MRSLFFALCAFLACASVAQAQSTTRETDRRICAISSFGEGVVEFVCQNGRHDFTRSLVYYLARNPQLEVSAMISQPNSPTLASYTYIVTFRAER